MVELRDQSSYNVAPTVTLAQLYEAQQLFFDALAIYKQIQMTNPSEDILSRIDRLNAKVFNDQTLVYSTVLKNIFSKDEILKFRFLPQDKYKLLMESMTKDYAQELEIDEEEFDEAEVELEDSEEIEDLYKPDEPVEGIDHEFNDLLSKPKPMIEETSQAELPQNWKEMRVSELSLTLLEIIGKNKTLGEITIEEIAKIEKQLNFKLLRI